MSSVEKVEVPSVIFELLEQCNSSQTSSDRMKTLAIALAIVLFVVLIGCYYYIKSLGGIGQIQSYYNNVSDNLGHLDQSRAGFETTPIPAPPTYGEGNQTSAAAEGCVKAHGPAEDVINLSRDEILDHEIIKQKISEFDTIYKDDFTPTDSAYEHERFITGESLGQDTSENHKKWAEQVVKKGGSARQMVQPFDPEEALQGYGIRNTTPKKPKAYGLQATSQSLYDPNDDE